MLRKLSAAGAQSTLSPVRKSTIGKENAEAGPSKPRRMEPVGEASEEDLSARIRNKAEEVHRMELALQQKARILVGAKDRESTPEPVAPQREPMGRAKTVVAADDREDIDRKPAGKREGKAAKPRQGLLEVVCQNLTLAMEMAETPRGFRSACTFNSPSYSCFMTSS